VSISVPPAEVKRSSWAKESVWMVSLPNVRVPSASAETAHQLSPSSLYSIDPP
jgi:hypothetical protein